MKKVLLFVCVMMVLWSRENMIIAQSVSSAVKTIYSNTNIPATEPMIAVNPTDQNNFIAVYSNWHDPVTRYAGYSRTTDNGLNWSSGELPFMQWYDQADPVIAFDADGKAYYAYLDIGSLGRRSING
jgi:hypothetical protein